METNKYYTLLGKQDFIDEDGLPRLNTESDQIYAKCSLSQKPKQMVATTELGVEKNSYKYYIAKNAKGEIYDPNESYQPKASFIDTVCKDSNRLMQVNQYVFNKYLNFLKTNNSAWIREANRDLK